MVCGGMIAIMCTSTLLVSGICCDFQSLWLIMGIVVVFGSALLAIRAQCMASTVVLWSVGYVQCLSIGRIGRVPWSRILCLCCEVNGIV